MAVDVIACSSHLVINGSTPSKKQTVTSWQGARNRIQNYSARAGLRHACYLLHPLHIKACTRTPSRVCCLLTRRCQSDPFRKQPKCLRQTVFRKRLKLRTPDSEQVQEGVGCMRPFGCPEAPRSPWCGRARHVGSYRQDNAHQSATICCTAGCLFWDAAAQDLRSKARQWRHHSGSPQWGRASIDMYPEPPGDRNLPMGNSTGTLTSDQTKER